MLKRYYAGALGADDSGGTPNTFFDAYTGFSDSATFAQETANLVGVAGAVLTIQVTTLTIINNPIGKLLVNGTEMHISQTFPITLNGSGLGSFLFRIEGQAHPSGGASIVNAVLTIVGMTAGFPSTPISLGLFKAF